MATFKITLAYDGTAFVGWQRQAAGTSIQGLLEDALGQLDQGEVSVTGAGRTDAGVHALGQVASFSLRRAIDGAALARALNGRLPEAVRVLAADVVPETFHARFGARRKTYRYRIWNADVLSPFERQYAWHVQGPLDRDAMAAAAGLIEGRHDFAAFRAAGGTTRTTEREVFSSTIDGGPKGPHYNSPHYNSPHYNSPHYNSSAGLQACSTPLITYEIAGDGFLRYMVRNIVGTLVEIGRGRQRIEWIGEVLAGRDRTRGGPTAPPHGLALVAVEYDDAGLLAAGR